MFYYPWGQDEDDDSLAWIEKHPDEIRKKIYRLNKGMSVNHWNQGDWFPDDIIYDISPDKGIKMADAVPNYSSLLFVSECLKCLLEKESDANFEFLRIGVRNKKGHTIKEDYFIANLLDSVECVDKGKSDFRMDSIIKSQVDIFKLLVLDESKLEKNIKIFRLKEKMNLIIIREDLAQKIKDEGCTGVAFSNLDEYGIRYRD